MVTPISNWVEVVEVILPSGKQARVRQLDVVELILEDGNVPNFLLQAISNTSGVAKEATVPGEDIPRVYAILGKVARALMAEPRIVDQAGFERGEGILLSHLKLSDKMFLFQWGMGGQAAVDNARRFSEQQGGDMVALPTGENL